MSELVGARRNCVDEGQVAFMVVVVSHAADTPSGETASQLLPNPPGTDITAVSVVGSTGKLPVVESGNKYQYHNDGVSRI